MTRQRDLHRVTLGAVLGGWLGCPLPLLAQASAASGIPFKPAGEVELPGAAQWIVALLACGMALAALLWWLRLRGSPSQPWRAGRHGWLRVLERTALSPATQLVVVQYGDRRLLFVVASQQATCIRDDAWQANGLAEGGSAADGSSASDARLAL